MAAPERRVRTCDILPAVKTAVPATALCLLAALAAPGCLERKISITSEPPGALVWVNDVEVGRTPAETDFVFYGDYDVRVRLEGYEPIRTHMKARAPWYECPPFDLVATAIPARIENVVRWHFVLEKPAGAGQEPEKTEQDLLDRAREMRERLDPAVTAPGGK